jgi:hypothetical protein
MIYPNYEDQKDFYERMLIKDSLNFKALYGLGLAEHNNHNIESALKIFK